ncbi:MAG: sugar transferase [Acidobacteria bacterium]|nr:MAG: sugar transferase [Acidobacteriota bacterium]
MTFDFRAAGYRLWDIAGAAGGLLLLAPLLAGIALLVLVCDGRPLLFHQVRVGKKGRLFRVWKFRTMRAGVPGSSITTEDDGRITPLGSRLRKFKLDELPQLFNVLKGDLSLIGPRPEVPRFVELQHPLWQAILEVRPGITDLATLVYRDEEQRLRGRPDHETHYRKTLLQDKLWLNLEYLRHRTLWLDLKLIWLTVRYSFLPAGFDSRRLRRLFVQEMKSL